MRHYYDFAADQLHLGRGATDLGSAFQDFVSDLLAFEYSDLHVFPAVGKDGAIDLVATSPVRTFIECKHVTGHDAIRTAWAAVEAKLYRCLQPGAPAKGQRQFLPWYVAGRRRLRRYVFCTSALFANERHRIQIAEAISTTLTALSARPALGHLADAEVEVLDWRDLVTRLAQRPGVAFRWFPASRPTGLRPLRDEPTIATFRTFLSSTELPYYSRERHRAAHAADTTIPSETELLTPLLTQEFDNGLLITGKGGAGKTRLTLELGHQAEAMGWTVLKADDRVTRSAIAQVLASSPRSFDLLLLLDYVELLADYSDVVQYIGDVNESGAHKIRFIANCRTSYYKNLEDIPAQRRFEITPDGDPHIDEYQRAVVRTILAHAGVESDLRVQICRDSPVLAVFMMYLARSGKRGDLAELVREGDFGRWIARRVQQTFGSAVTRRLASFVLTLPVREAALSQLDPSDRELFEHLASDGWIEPSATGKGRVKWSTLHDVFADRVALSYLVDLRGSVPQFVDDVLRRAEMQRSIGSALVAFQRIADFVSSVRWFEIVHNRLRGETSGWAPVRSYVLRSNLFTPFEKLQILESGPQLWLTNLGSPDLQSFLSLTCKEIYNNPAQYAGLDLSALERWTVLAAAHVTYSNHILRHGMRLFGAALRGAAQAWMHLHPVDVDTHYVLVAWLDHLGSPAVVQGAVTTWLGSNQRHILAQFVYRAWLDAGGDVDVVSPAFRKWFALHSNVEGVDFVIRSWLRRRGDFELVRETAFEIVRTRSEAYDTTFLLRAISEQRQAVLPDDILSAVLRWCRQHPEGEDVLWRLTKLRHNLQRQELNGEVITTFEHVLSPWLADDSQPDGFYATQITILMWNAVMIAERNGELADRADAMFRRWLLHPRAFELADALPLVQRPVLVRRVDHLINVGTLDRATDNLAIERFSRWVRRWSQENIARIEPRPAWLRLARTTD